MATGVAVSPVGIVGGFDSVPMRLRTLNVLETACAFDAKKVP
jgi:hypothetical protein